MRRRTFLGVLASGLFAGCTEDREADVERTYTASKDPFLRPPTEPGGPDGSDHPLTTNPGVRTPIDVFRAKLVRAGISVVSLDRSGSTAMLTYEGSVSPDDQLRHDMRVVGLAYATAVERGLSVETLHVVVVRDDATALGSYILRLRWVRRYLDHPVIPDVYVNHIYSSFQPDPIGSPTQAPADGR